VGNTQDILSDFFNTVETYIAENIIEENKQLINYQAPESLAELMNFAINQTGCSEQELLDYTREYLKYALNTNNKQFFNQLYAGFNMPAFMGEIITALVNTSMYTYEVAPVATLAENELITKMCKIAGFESGDGTFVTGGSNANLIAMFSARNKVYPKAKTEGLYGLAPLSMFVSEQSHYSFVNNANVLGIGSNYVYKIKSDREGRLLTSDLENQILISSKKGEKPFFIAGTAGTTMLGAFDPFSEIAEIANKHQIWFHVDGSFGGSLILSNKNKSMFHGLKSADSFAWNPHKLMNIPLVCSVILVKEKKRLYQNLTEINDDYIYHDTETASCDLGKKSIQCGRRVDSLKLWLAWKFYGDKGYETRMDNLISMAQYFEQLVIENPNFELLSPRQSLTICFRYLPKHEEDIEKFNLNIRESLRKSGKSMVNFGYLNGKFSFRWVVVNADTTENDIDTFFANFNEVANSLALKKPFF